VPDLNSRIGNCSYPATLYQFVPQIIPNDPTCQTAVLATYATGGVGYVYPHCGVSTDKAEVESMVSAVQSLSKASAATAVPTHTPQCNAAVRSAVSLRYMYAIVAGSILGFCMEPLGVFGIIDTW
jgi:hypothetical protein